MTVDHGRFALPWFAEMPLITHVGWASLCVWIAGFSFETLRLSTILLTGFGVIGLWLLALRCGLSRASAAFVTCAFALNPSVFLFTNTFMTDVPFAAWSVWSALSLVYALRRPSMGAVTVAAACGVAAILLRQTGVLLPAMFVPAFLMVHGWSRRHAVLALLPVCAALAAYGGFTIWIDLTARRGATYAAFLSQMTDVPQWALAKELSAIRARFLNILFHLSWMLLPVALWTTHRPATRRGRAGVVGAVVVAMAALWLTGRVGPWSVSTIFNLGLGPANVRGEDVVAMSLPRVPDWIFRAFTVASAGSLALMLVHVAAYVRRTIADWRTVDRFSVSVALMFAGVVLTMIAAMAAFRFYDRYLFFLIPLLSLLCAIAARTGGPAPWRAAQVLGAAVLAGYAAFSAVGARDFFEWRRAHWAVVQSVVATQHYPLVDIDGGLEFDRTVSGRIQFPESPRVVVTLGDLAGYRRCETVPFSRWMASPHVGHVFVLVPAGAECPTRR
jgi:hypothetical protein